MTLDSIVSIFQYIYSFFDDEGSACIVHQLAVCFKVAHGLPSATSGCSGLFLKATRLAWQVHGPLRTFFATGAAAFSVIFAPAFPPTTGTRASCYDFTRLCLLG